MLTIINSFMHDHEMVSFSRVIDLIVIAEIQNMLTLQMMQ